MSDDEHYTQFDNNLDVDDGSNARGTTYPPETEDERLHVVEGDDGFMFVEDENKGLPAKPEAESTIKQFFPPLSLLHGDGERHTVVTAGRPKGITDVSQLYNQPNETFQVEQREQEMLELIKMKGAFENENYELQRRLEEEKQSVKNITNSWKCEIHEMTKKHDQLEEEKIIVKDMTNSWKHETEEMTMKHDQACERLRNTTEEQNERIKAMMKDLQAYQQLEAKWNRQSNNQREQISELEKERDELLIRLSKLAGDRLTHENTNIADLSDLDRPTNLSAVYSELYDNEWTDAFEELTSRLGFDEQEAIAKLLKIILTSFHRCRQLTWQRYHSMKAVSSTLEIGRIISSCKRMVHEFVKEAKALSPESCVMSETSEIQNPSSKSDAGTKETTTNEGTESMDWDRSEDQNRDKATVKHLTSTLTIDQETQIKAIWRSTTNELKNEAVKHLHIVLLTEFGISSEDSPYTSKYLKSCIDICWKMGVQEKPMHLATLAENEDGRDMIFDLDKFRAYTKTGKTVAFLVWPALFLHEGGAILAKGIAQGCNETYK